MMGHHNNQFHLVLLIIWIDNLNTVNSTTGHKMIITIKACRVTALLGVFTKTNKHQILTTQNNWASYVSQGISK